ncbi:hypothetical protein LV75_001426 [Actinokineospora diospyrosa]|uniref:Uncharacterized protein n=1 Tax=Actinokineospora diospyrosa TaxID=103728 RepID=A0ABT1I8M7_9PSEU|nr:hypothetical protein [Actinokineospora diospyrosa]
MQGPFVVWSFESTLAAPFKEGWARWWRSAPAHPLSAWTLGPCGAMPLVRSASALLLSAWTVGVAGARPARWGGLVLRGGTTPVASSAAGPAFGPLLCGSASGVVGAPRKTSSPHRAFRIVADRTPSLPPGNEASPGAEGGGPKFLLRTPSHGLRQDQPDQKPPNTQLTDAPRQNRRLSSTLWTTADVVDSQHLAAVAKRVPVTARSTGPAAAQQSRCRWLQRRLRGLPRSPRIDLPTAP